MTRADGVDVLRAFPGPRALPVIASVPKQSRWSADVPKTDGVASVSRTDEAWPNRRATAVEPWIRFARNDGQSQMAVVDSLIFVRRLSRVVGGQLRLYGADHTLGRYLAHAGMVVPAPSHVAQIARRAGDA